MWTAFGEYLHQQKPKTNADRIRAMSDEELAEFISNCGCPDHARSCKASCKGCTMEWLKQPAEEESRQDCTYNKDGHCTAQKMMPECDAKSCDRRNGHAVS